MVKKTLMRRMCRYTSTCLSLLALQHVSVVMSVSKGNNTACTLRTSRNLQWHRAVSPRQHGSCTCFSHCV